MNHSFIGKVIEFTEVSIEEGLFEENSYDPYENVIRLNSLTETFFGRLVKGATGRPDQDGFSLAHELGHAIFEKLDLEVNPQFIKIFGEVGEYSGGTLAMLNNTFNEKPDEYLTAYGVTDPEEDFADSFAMLCTKRRMKVDSYSPKIRRKLKFILDIMATIEKAA